MTIRNEEKQLRLGLGQILRYADQLSTDAPAVPVLACDRQFGILVTISFLAHQAYQELHSDRLPVVVIAGADIAGILVKAGLGTSEAVREWLTAEFPPAIAGRLRNIHLACAFQLT